jgi:hypothetical protein
MAAPHLLVSLHCTTEKSWKVLEEAIHQIHNQNGSGLSYETLYRWAAGRGTLRPTLPALPASSPLLVLCSCIMVSMVAAGRCSVLLPCWHGGSWACNSSRQPALPLAVVHVHGTKMCRTPHGPTPTCNMCCSIGVTLGSDTACAVMFRLLPTRFLLAHMAPPAPSPSLATHPPTLPPSHPPTHPPAGMPTTWSSTRQGRGCTRGSQTPSPATCRAWRSRWGGGGVFATGGATY